MRILVATDNSDERSLLTKLLSDDEHEVVAVGNGAEALRIVQGPTPPGLILIDVQMSEMDALEVIRRLKPIRLNQPLHIIIATAQDQLGAVVEALDAGADDYLFKPVDPQELLVRVRVGQRHLELQQDFLTAVETLQGQALQDELTGLLNRRAFFSRMESEFQRARRMGSGVAVVMADLDHFKQVNDTYGHLTGDVVLAETALRLGRTMRAFDVVGRYGGEEFAACLSLSMDSDVRTVCERIRMAMASEPFVTDHGPLRVTISVGCVIAEEIDESSDTQAVLDKADEALYAAKRLGRNRCVVRNLRRSDDTVQMEDT